MGKVIYQIERTVPLGAGGWFQKPEWWSDTNIVECVGAGGNGGQPTQYGSSGGANLAGGGGGAQYAVGVNVAPASWPIWIGWGKPSQMTFAFDDYGAGTSFGYVVSCGSGENGVNFGGNMNAGAGVFQNSNPVPAGFVGGGGGGGVNVPSNADASGWGGGGGGGAAGPLGPGSDGGSFIYGAGGAANGGTVPGGYLSSQGARDNTWGTDDEGYWRGVGSGGGGSRSPMLINHGGQYGGGGGGGHAWLYNVMYPGGTGGEPAIFVTVWVPDPPSPMVAIMA